MGALRGWHIDELTGWLMDALRWWHNLGQTLCLGGFLQSPGGAALCWARPGCAFSWGTQTTALAAVLCALQEETAFRKVLGGRFVTRNGADLISTSERTKGSATPAPTRGWWHFPAGSRSRVTGMVTPAASFHLSPAATPTTDWAACPRLPWLPGLLPTVATPAPSLHAALCSVGGTGYAFDLHVQLPCCGTWSGFACTSDHSCIQTPSAVTITTSTRVIKVITRTNWACDCMGISTISFFFFFVS